MGGEEDLGSGPVDVGVLEHGHQGCRQNWVQAGVEFVDQQEPSAQHEIGTHFIFYVEINEIKNSGTHPPALLYFRRQFKSLE